MDDIPIYRAEDIPIYRADHIPIEPGMSISYYRTKEWLWLREGRLRLDHHTCTVPGCSAPATHVDHIISRRAGGVDAIWNLRSLCRDHDQQIKERPNGKRAHDGKLTVRGCHADGSPLDPTHPWYKSR
jgi:5-methylcytosine-specific restriction enzyme A